MDEFIKFLKENDILAAIIATVISTYVSRITESFINDIIMPIINRDGNDDKKPDINKLKNYKFNCFGFNLKVGNFLVNLIKFLSVLFLVFIVFLIKGPRKTYKLNWEKYNRGFIRK